MRDLLVVVPLPDVTRTALELQYRVHYVPEGLAAAHAKPWAGEIVAIITNGSVGFSEFHMRRYPALRIICTAGVGHENVDLAAAKRHGLVVANVPDANSETVADHAMGFLLALCRGYGPLTQALQAGAWNEARQARPTLNGGAIGLIGMGRIGQAIARRAAAFQMTVRYHGPHVRVELPYDYVDTIEALARSSDFLVAACPGGTSTQHLVNAEVLAALGPNGYLVNVARGSVVDTESLIQALRNRSIAGAGLDVVEGEPELAEGLKGLDNVLLTPHVAGRSPASEQAQASALLDNLTRYFLGQRPRSCLVGATWWPEPAR